MKTKNRDVVFELKSITDTGAFAGYGSVFGVVDSYDEIVAPGAFKASLAAHSGKGSMPALLWQHRSDSPIGVFTRMEEDDHGLYVEGQLAMKTVQGAEAYELLKMKAISGMSIGFVPRTDTYDGKTGIRTLTQVDLWETSLVTFPANPDAQVQSVRSVDEITDLRAAERHLRDSGMSRSAAVAFIARVKSLQRESDDGENEQLFAAIKRNTSILLEKNHG